MYIRIELKIDLNSIANQFVEVNERRKNFFGAIKSNLRVCFEIFFYLYKGY